MSTTLQTLKARFGDVDVIDIKKIAREYLGVSPRHAVRSPSLKVTPFRLSDSRKAPWLVSLVELARVIDAQIGIAPATPVLTDPAAQLVLDLTGTSAAINGTPSTPEQDAGISSAPQADPQPEVAGSGDDGAAIG